MNFKEGNMSYLCPGEMSVASSADHLTADSPLLDTQDENIQVSRLTQWVQNSSTSSQIDSASGNNSQTLLYRTLGMLVFEFNEMYPE